MTDDDEPIREDEGYSLVSQPGEDKAEQRREEAFNAGYSWNGETFEGLTCSRKDLWTALCYRAGFPPLKAGFDDLQWFVPLAKALVFVCITPSKTLRRLRALGIDEVVNAFTEWVDDNVRLNQERDILDLGQRILVDSNENQAEAIPSGGPGK